jgi:hypothetical protein
MQTMKLEYRLKLADLIAVDRGRTRPEIMVYFAITKIIYLNNSREITFVRFVSLLLLIAVISDQKLIKLSA